MKLAFFILTISLNFLCISALKLLDNFVLIIVVFITSLAVGLLIRTFKKEKQFADALGFGIVYGSLTSFFVTICSFFLLATNLST